MTRKPVNRGVTKSIERAQKRTTPAQNSDKEIWSAMLEGRYRVTVHLLRPYRGKLTVRDGEKLIHSQKIALMYHVVFGPDADDISGWQNIATAIVDNLRHTPELPRKGE